MKESKSTRSSKLKDDPDAPPKAAKVPALRKVFYTSQKLLEFDGIELKLERFYHPGKGKPTLFLTSEKNKYIMEVLEYAEPRRSWLINQDVCSNGKLYLTTPFDTTFLALHHIKKHCTQRALALDTINYDQGDSVGRLLMTYVRPEQLKCIADGKTAGDNMLFYKYNAEKALAWLALKTRRVANAFRRHNVYCGFSSLSQNYTKSVVMEQEVSDVDYLRMACEFVGGYVDMDIHEELIQYLALPTEQESKKDLIEKAGKRKSLQTINSSDKKKLKLELNENATENPKSSLLDDSVNSLNDKSESETIAKPTPLKERTLTAKEKALAKGAKGSKSIASFFKR